MTLEGRQLLSGAAAAPQVVAAHVAKRVVHHPIVLLGATSNTVVLKKKNLVEITGKGKFSKLGQATVSSTTDVRTEKALLASPWLIHIDLVLSTAKGDVSVRLTPGPIGADPFAMPVHLKYTIQGGTGSYENAVGTGLVDLKLLPGQPSLKEYDQLFALLKSKGVRFSLEFHPGKASKFGDFSDFWYNAIQIAVRASPSFRGAKVPNASPAAKHR
jgi:hypothetical protein